MTNDYETKIAMQNAHCISDEDAYFEARPQIDNHDRRKVFQAGHQRGYEAAHASQQARIDALEAKLAEVSKDAVLAELEKCAKLAENMPLNSDKAHLAYRFSNDSKAMSWDIAFAIRTHAASYEAIKKDKQ